MKKLTSTALTFVLLLAGCSTTRGSQHERSAGSENDAPLEIIDVHTHTRFDGRPERTSKIAVNEDQYFKEWKEAGVVAAISHVAPDDNGYVDHLRQKNVIFCGGVGDHVDVKHIENGLKAGRFGCIKIYLGYVHRWAYDAAYRPIYKLAEKYNVPVVFHTGDTYSTQGKLKYADPLTVDEVAVDFPKVTFVIAHCGNPWIQSAAEVAYKNPNVYLDGSALMIGDLDRDPAAVDETVVKPLAWIFAYVEDPTKLMFGTDWPLTNIKGYVNAFKKAIPKEHWKAVFHDNAVRVFKFKTGK